MRISQRAEHIGPYCGAGSTVQGGCGDGNNVREILSAVPDVGAGAHRRRASSRTLRGRFRSAGLSARRARPARMSQTIPMMLAERRKRRRASLRHILELRMTSGGHRCQDEIPINSPERTAECECSRSLWVVDPPEIGNKAALHTKHGVFSQVLTIRRKHMGYQGLVAGCGHNEMNVSRAIGMSAQAFEQLTDGTVTGDRVKPGLHCSKPVTTVRIAREHAPQVPNRLDPSLLYVVEALFVRLPCVNLRAGDRSARDVEHSTAHEERLALAIETDICAERIPGRAGNIERAENRVLGTGSRAWVTKSVNQHRDPEHVGQENEFLSPVTARLPRLSQKIDAVQPLLM